MVVLPEGHPFAPGGRLASLLIRDRDLADGLAIGFDGPWKKGDEDLRDIEFQQCRRRNPGVAANNFGTREST